MENNQNITAVSPSGQNFSIMDVCEEIKHAGFVPLRNFINCDQSNIIKSILDTPHRLNSNQLSFVYNNDSEFFSNAIGFSRTVFNVITSNAVQQICKCYLGPVYRLKCHRVYRTLPGFIDHPWHTDNKAFGVKTDDLGLAFIIYLQDTEDGATEVVKGSHKYSKKFRHSVFTDPTIQNNYSDNIIQVTGNVGDLMIADTKTIHRGSNWRKKKSDRVSLWFQIDRNIEDAERLLINPSFLPDTLNTELSRFLGFGLNANMPVHPENTGITTMPLGSLVKLTLKAGVASIYHPIAKTRRLLPEPMKIIARKILRRNTWN